MEDFKFNIGLNTTEHAQKPTSKEASVINRKGFPTKEVSIEELSECLSNGMTFTPSHFIDGKRNNKNFLGTYVFALDFDDNQDPTDKIEQLKEYGINTNLYYPSFSDTPEYRKFRLVIVFDTLIEDRKLRDKIQLAIMDIVKDSDRACKDASRMFYGSNSCSVIDSNPNSLEDSLIHLHNIINSKTTRNGTKGKNDKDLKKCTNTLVPYNTIREYQISTLIEQTYDIKQHFNYEQAMVNSKVFNSFANGGHLSYSVLFNLISNMQYVKGGLKWVKECMDKAGSYNYSDYELLRTMRKYNYLPSNMIGFDSEIEGEYSNVWHLDRTSNSVEIIKKAEKFDSDILYGRFASLIERISNREFLKQVDIMIPRINVCSVGVGIGKSHKLKRQLRQGNIVFAFPTHYLKREFEEDIKSYSIPYAVTPEIPTFNDKEINTMYDNLQAMGEGLKANKLIKNVADGIAVIKVDSLDDLIEAPKYEGDSELAQDYLNKMSIAYNSDSCVLTTHQRALLTPDSFRNKNHIVFDEDIIDSLIVQSELKVAQIDYLIDTVKSNVKSVKSDLINIKKHLLSIRHAEITQTSKNMIIRDSNALKKALSTVKGGATLIKLIESDYTLKYVAEDSVERFYSVTHRELPKYKQITIASATAEPYFYDKLMKNKDYKFHSLGNAKNRNKIIQYTGKRYSRYAMSKGDVPNIEEGYCVLTYKAHKDKFAKSDDIVHFGNSEGYNHLKGEDICVVGTPTRPLQVILLYATILGIKWDNSDLGKNTKQTVIYEGQGNIYKYSIITYKNKGLADIDLRLAKKDIEQAVGRARANRTDSNVEIYSAIPVPSADEFRLKKELI